MAVQIQQTEIIVSKCVKVNLVIWKALTMPLVVFCLSSSGSKIGGHAHAL